MNMIPCTSMKNVICRTLHSNRLSILCYADQKYSKVYVPNFIQRPQFVQHFSWNKFLCRTEWAAR